MKSACAIFNRLNYKVTNFSGYQQKSILDSDLALSDVCKFTVCDELRLFQTNVIYLHHLIPGYAEEIHVSVFRFFITLFFPFLNLRRKPIPTEPNLIFLCFGFWQIVALAGFLNFIQYPVCKTSIMRLK